MSELRSYGAAGEVTGSSHLLIGDNGSRVLIDCGAFQGSKDQEARNSQPLDFEAENLDGVVFSHGHLDHIGRAAQAVAEGYRGDFYTTPLTADLIGILLRDSLNIARQNATRGGPVLPYTESDVNRVLSRIKRVPFGEEFRVGDFITQFSRAGHIGGAASIALTEQNAPLQTVVFSGDLGNDDPTDIVKPKELFDRADVLVMEATYGGQEHPVEDPREVLAQEIAAIEKSGGTLLIPAFSIHKTPRILQMLKEMKRGGKISPKVKIILDGVMALEARKAYRNHPEDFKEELNRSVLEKNIRINDELFAPDGLITTPSREQSLAIDSMRGAKIVIAAGGMLQGGRIRQHAATFLERRSTRVLLTGYQAEGSLGWQLQQGMKELDIDGQHIRVNEDVAITSMGSLSSHAGHGELMRTVHAPEGLKQVVLLHGDDDRREALAQSIYSERGIRPILPQKGDIINLSVYDSLAPAAD